MVVIKCFVIINKTAEVDLQLVKSFDARALVTHSSSPNTKERAVSLTFVDRYYVNKINPVPGFSKVQFCMSIEFAKFCATAIKF